MLRFVLMLSGVSASAGRGVRDWTGWPADKALPPIRLSELIQFGRSALKFAHRPIRYLANRADLAERFDQVVAAWWSASCFVGQQSADFPHGDFYSAQVL
jgi:hypothetical protein